MKYIEFDNLISKYRSVIMGIATLWIVLFHAGYPDLPIIRHIVSYGYVGVELFLFLSGYGIYCSLSKNSNVFNFYKRRIVRIYPAFIITLASIFIFRHLRYGLPIVKRDFIANAGFYAYFFGSSDFVFNWYIFAIIYLYILSPLFFHFMKENQLWIILIPSILINILAFNTPYTMSASRVFVYLLGMWFAKKKLETPNEKISLTIVYALGMFGIVSELLCREYLGQYISSHALYWYPFFFATIAIINSICQCFELLNKPKALTALFSTLGKCSLEIYLLDVYYNDEFAFLLANYVGWNHWWFWLVIILLIILCGIVFHYILDYFISLIQRNK